MSGPSEWLDSLDQLRRHQGRALESLGMGAQESDYRVVLSRSSFRLRHYAVDPSNTSDGPVLLIIPAPIKGPYIWDMSPERSVVGRACDEGFDVYMVVWTEPGVGESQLGLEDYAGSMIDECVEYVAKRSSQKSIALAGHSLGGTFAALYSAYRPERVAALVLIEAPLHFDEASGAFRRLLKLDVPADALLASSHHIPGSLLNLISATAAPGTFVIERYLDYFASHTSLEDWQTHWRAVRWTLDELPLPRKLFDEVVEQLYRGDEFIRGELMFGKTKLNPGGVKAPLIAVYNPSSRVIPPESILDFYHAVSSDVKELVTYSGDTGVALQHVGALIGSNAHRGVWPQVLSWLKEVRERDITVYEVR